MWTLILTLFIISSGNYGTGVHSTVTTIQGFTTKQACESAGNQWNINNRKLYNWRDVPAQYTCIKVE